MRVSSHERGTVVDAYLDEMGTHTRLDVEEERALAERLVGLRREYWHAILSSFEHLPAMVELVAQEVDENLRTVVLIAHRWVARSPGSQRATHFLELRRQDLVDALTSAGVEPTLVGNALEARDPNEDVRSARAAFHAVRDRFVAANLRLVVSLASKYGRYHMPLADRVQEGNLGLLKAVNRFDPARGVRFATYAAWWIRHAITRALTDRGRIVRIPAHLQALFTRMRIVQRRLRASTGREPTDQELALEMKIDVEKVVRVRTEMDTRVVELDVPVGDPIHEHLTDHDHDVGAVLDEQRNLTIAILAFRDLPHRQRNILLHRFGLDNGDVMTLHEMGVAHGVSRERIRQIQKAAISQLREVVERSPARTIDVPSPRDAPWNR